MHLQPHVIPGEVLLRAILYQSEVSRRVMDVLTSSLGEAGIELSDQHLRILVQLRGRGPSHLTSLANRLGVSRSTMTRLVDQLESKGLVRRVRSPRDGRALHLELEPVADAAVDTAVTVADAMADTVYEGVALDDVERLGEVFGRLDANLGA